MNGTDEVFFAGILKGSRPKLNPYFFQVCPALPGKLGWGRRRRVLRIVIKFHHHHTTNPPTSHQVEDCRDIHLALTERAVVDEAGVLTIEVFEVHMLDERQVVSYA